MSGERRIPAKRTDVWEALNDPERLQQAIPGCEAIEKTSDNEMTAKVALKIGPMAARFSGKVKLENLNPPESYTITGEGNGGAMGFAKGGADVRLEEVGPSETLLRYNVKAQVGGKMAQLGGRLIDSTANQMAGLFFDRLAAQLTPTMPPASGLATPAPVSHKHIPIAGAIPSEILGVPIPILLGGAAMLWVLYLIFLSS
jgi:carbon monoxide dehydrogenase subunit G